MGAAASFSAATGARAEGKMARNAAIFEARQYEQDAGQAVAVAQREAEEERSKADLVQSRALALAAAGGGGASDTSVMNLMADIEAAGEYRAEAAIYRGAESARRMRLAGEGKRYGGELAFEGGKQRGRSLEIAGIGKLFEGGSLFTKYGGTRASDIEPVKETVPGQYSLVNRQYG